jgi:prophage antirepressor-like protein
MYTTTTFSKLGKTHKFPQWMANKNERRKTGKKSRQFQQRVSDKKYETLASSSSLAHFALPHQPHHSLEK